VGIGHVDLEGHFLRLNQKFCEIVDYEQEELLQLSFQDITHPEDLERDLEEFRQLLAGEIETYSIEKRYIRKDSSIVWVKLTVSVVWAASGEPSYIVGVIEDITERKRAEEELKESSRRTENILESITDEFFAVDREWRFTYVNERALRSIHTLKGDEELTREELLGKNLWEVVPEVVGSVFDHKYHEAMGEQEPVEFEAYSPWSNRWGEVRACPSEEGLLVYARDITERKRAEQEIVARTHQQAEVAELGLRALESDDLQALLDDAVVLIAQTLGVEYVKIVEPLPDGEEMLLRAGVGWREGLVGRATESAGSDSEAGYSMRYEEPVIVEDVNTERRFEPSELMADHGIRSGMTVVIHGQEEHFGVLCAHSASSRSFSEDDANFLQAVANVLATPIERKRAQERLEEVRELERSRIARDLHDDALQDLSGALVDAQLLRRSVLEDPEEAARQAEQLLASLDRIGPRLRGAIYDLRLESEQNRPFSELLEALIKLQSAISTECEISLEVQGESLSGSLGKMDGELLRIVREALINARRHSGAKHVWVRVGSSEEKLYAEVEDDGRGFDVTREPSATSATSRGGMGIRGMRERARALGGELKVESEPGRGTKVLFELALTKEPELQPEVEEEVRILLVEDHASIREALASSFEGEGFEVVGQAGSLAEARQMLEEGPQKIDVAVLDLGLPDGYGADLIEELREKNPQAQALVLSASLDRANTARAVEAGAAGVLNKTAHLDKVVEAVRRLRAGETLMPLEEVVELLRYAGSERREEYEARHALEKLTPREREVLQALAEGLDSEGIAEKLHISLRTQRNHMSSIFSKLGVHSQLQALVFAVRHGVVEIL
jgi:PAS domain S-box-containing protein